nr:recombinase family protein [Saccharothrix syringae]
MTVSALPRPSTLAEWIAATIPPGISALDTAPVGSLRFLFYGRASTREHQDSRSSRAWQLDVSRRLTGGHGAIVGEYFEVGCSRQVPWHLRPRAAAMLRYIAANADRVDAVVVGEYERAFLDGAQVRELRAVLEEFGVQLWLPEAEGPVDFDNSAHEALLSLLAKRSLTEVLRSRHRVVTAMRMQTVEQGRYLGGRPPYGYRLVDAGPHPNRALARRGVRQQRLVPNPVTAPVVKLIFSLRLAGHSAAGIARHLNEQSVPSPGVRAGLRHRPDHPGHQEQHPPGRRRRRRARLPVGGQAAVRGVRAEDGLVSFPRSCRVPVPSRSHQRPYSTGRRAGQPLPARGPPARPHRRTPHRCGPRRQPRPGAHRTAGRRARTRLALRRRRGSLCSAAAPPGEHAHHTGAWHRSLSMAGPGPGPEIVERQVNNSCWP